ncbi:MAG: right-handed parallel beta-helix repeat-containing protein [Oscillospiraceae bacterium]|nr:right-handed parallel beta-helix repeat-containing protein [Oscillospiraceae bacterium]
MDYNNQITKLCGTADEIIEAVSNAEENDFIGIISGTYEFIGTHRIVFRNKRNVTLRSLSGCADDVVFKGGGFHKKDGYRQTPIDEPVCIASDNNGITISGITIRDSNCHGIKVQGEGNNANITVERCKFIDICERMIKGSAGENGYVVPGVAIANNYFEDTQIPVASDHMDIFDGDYIAGIDMMVLDGAIISNNKFVNIRGMNGGGRGAIFIWVGSKNVTAEQNVIVNCDRGICYGNPGNTSVEGGNLPYYVDGGVICGNVVTNPVSHGIELAHTKNITVRGNEVICKNEAGRGISETSMSEEKRSGGLIISNNTVRGVIFAPGAEINGNIKVR